MIAENESVGSPAFPPRMLASIDIPSAGVIASKIQTILIFHVTLSPFNNFWYDA